MPIKLFLLSSFFFASLVSLISAQNINAARDDQINRLKNYTLDAIMPSGLVRDSLVLNGSSFHPATPDAAGFALLGLSALDHLGKLPDADHVTIVDLEVQPMLKKIGFVPDEEVAQSP